MTDGLLKYVSFELDRHLYGFDIQIVKEVNPSTQITPVPRSAPHIRGLVNIRGQVVLVIDIAVLFGHGSRPISASSQIVILKTGAEIKRLRLAGPHLRSEQYGDKPVGFLVDRIGDVIQVEAATPPHLAEGDARYVRGVVHLDNRLLVVLNAAEMLAVDALAARPQGRPAS